MKMFGIIPEESADGVSLTLTARNVVYLFLGAVLALVLVGLLALVTGIAHRREVDAALVAREAAIADRDYAVAHRQTMISTLVRMSHTWDQESVTRAAAPAAMQQRCAAELMNYLNEAEQITFEWSDNMPEEILRITPAGDVVVP